MGACISCNEQDEDKQVIYANYAHLENMSGQICRRKRDDKRHQKRTNKHLVRYDQWNQRENERRKLIQAKKAELVARSLERSIAQIESETLQKKETYNLMEQNYYDLKTAVPADLGTFKKPLIIKKKKRSSILGKFVHFSDH